MVAALPAARPDPAPNGRVGATAAPRITGHSDNNDEGQADEEHSRSYWPRFDSDDFFGHQPASTATLPDPRPLLENLARCVIEVLAGARDLEQIARWVTDDVYRHLLKRVVLSKRARTARGNAIVRPAFSLSSPHLCEPRDGVVEAVVVVHGRVRTRAVAIRLEGLDQRWRATAINVL
jgi:hypothetical protein